MLEDVRHRLLHHAQHGQLQGARQLVQLGQRALHREPGRVQAGLELVEAGRQVHDGVPLRRLRVAGGAAQRGEHAAQVHEGLPGGLLDGLLRGGPLLRVLLGGQHGGLHRDHGEPVRDDVVQLRRDPLPLGLRGAGGGLLGPAQGRLAVPGPMPGPADH